MEQPSPDRLPRMNREQFRSWAAAQSRGRYELVAGEVVQMAPERVGYVDAKMSAWLALREGIAAAGVPCRGYGDGVNVEVDDDTLYEPDVLVQCGNRIDPEATAAPSPVIVVEVLSRSTRALDSGIKLADYFRVPSICHYLVLRSDRRAVLHHRRHADGGIVTALHGAGQIALDPPGIVITVEALFAD